MSKETKKLIKRFKSVWKKLHCVQRAHIASKLFKCPNFAIKVTYN